MARPLSKKTYELDQLMHMFLPIFEEHSYQDLLNTIDPDLDLAIQAQEKIAENPDDYDLEELHPDPWLHRLEKMADSPYTYYSAALIAALDRLSQNPILTDNQQAVFTSILKAKKPISTIQGQAGSGKSFATAEFIKELLDQDANVLVLAPTHVAVTNINQLIDEVRQVRFDQDDSALRLVQKENNTITVATMRSWAFRNAKVIEQIVKNGYADIDDEFDVILVDEAFATNGGDLINVMLQSLSTKTPLVLIGDPNQLASISNRPDKLFEILRAKDILHDAPVLTQVLRTKEQSIVGLAGAIMNNDMNALAQFYTKPDRNNQAPAQLMTPADFDSEYWLKTYLAVKLIQDIQQDLFAAMILVPTNALRIELNNSIQELRVTQGQLDDSKALILPNGVRLLEGDVVMISEKQEAHDYSQPGHGKVRLRGASRIKILDLNPKTPSGTKYNRYARKKLSWQDHRYKIKIYSTDLDQELIVDLFDLSSSGYNPGMYNPDVHELYKDLSLGYVATVNKVQGLSIDHVQVYIDRFYPHLSRNLLYSAVTRARETSDLIAEPKVLQKAMRKVDNNSKSSK